MFSIKCFFVLFCTFFALSNGQARAKFFRQDYTYIDATKSFYKMHTLHKSWADAKETCALEGATFYYPFDEDEAQHVTTFWNATQTFYWIYIGVSAPNVPEIFETVDGMPISKVYDNWGRGEPNNANGNESCVIMRRDGTLNDDVCTTKQPFACKKTLGSLEWNLGCDLHDVEYEYNEQLQRCYKFHSTPKTWMKAYATCHAEESYLAVVNSDVELRHLVEMTRHANKDFMDTDFVNGAVHLGFLKRDGGWWTIKNRRLRPNSYTKWGNGQPDGGDNENCGSMFYNGRLNDIGCDKKLFFICEHEVPLLQSDIELRYGNHTAPTPKP